LVQEVALAHVDELVQWFTEEVVPEGIDEVLWIDVHRQTNDLLKRINELDEYVRRL